MDERIVRYAMLCSTRQKRKLAISVMPGEALTSLAARYAGIISIRQSGVSAYETVIGGEDDAVAPTSWPDWAYDDVIAKRGIALVL